MSEVRPPRKRVRSSSAVARSIIYDEMGSRLGKGRKTGQPRQEVATPEGVSQNTKRIALERAKSAVTNRHFAEVRSLFENEITFLMALEQWLVARGEPGIDALPNSAVLEATARFYAEHGLKRPIDEIEKRESANGAEEVPMIAPDGREMFRGHPKPRKKSGVKLGSK